MWLTIQVINQNERILFYELGVPMLRKGIFVTGTDTDVGKTQVTAGLAAVLQKRLEMTKADAVQEMESKRVQTAMPRNDVQEIQRMQEAVQGHEEQETKRILEAEQEQEEHETQRVQEAITKPDEREPRAAVQLWKPVQSGAALGTPAADSYRLLHGSGLAG
ncbi:MAG: hypothetical protein JWM44_3610, partial [Bacilli bacterium]|nr:hypothetical protein [Bacilli bacterium]